LSTNAHRQIGEIAYAWGLNDLAHFSRCFKERYSVSSHDWRHGNFDVLPAKGGCSLEVVRNVQETSGAGVSSKASRKL
jgi:AraC-like DNA-binding protein